jgi:hypothetical protein
MKDHLDIVVLRNLYAVEADAQPRLYHAVDLASLPSASYDCKHLKLRQQGAVTPRILETAVLLLILLLVAGTLLILVRSSDGIGKEQGTWNFDGASYVTEILAPETQFSVTFPKIECWEFGVCWFL